LGVPLRDREGTILGHLAVFDDCPMREEPRRLLTFRIFAARAAAELVRLRLERQLRESEERLRDLYEEAPIAYVKEDLQSRFISANRAAQRILGIKPEEVPGIVGLSLVPDRPDAQRLAREQFAIQVRGEESHAALRRKSGTNKFGSAEVAAATLRNVETLFGIRAAGAAFCRPVDVNPMN
jgi:formate hydrogenlyase transcriptional activator